MSAKVISQGYCQYCGSSDAYTCYSDGGAHCFSCGHHVHSGISGYVRDLVRDLSEPILTLPNDIGHEYSAECLEWVDQYGLDASDLIKHGVKWSPRLNQLIFVYKAIGKQNIGCIQARNFSPTRTKYYNQGDVNNVLPIYYYTKPNEASRLVLVEDAISAIKVCRDVWVDAMPLLGSHLPLNKITLLGKAGYSKVSIWLDHDKYKEALSIGEKLRYIGVEVEVCTSDLDPKCYSADQIARKIGLVC